ncbi:MAG TPA: phosphoribosylformylglycinamidine synthase subunit PurS [Candidatus Caenarcaniphilales bacterium]|nr:phosphoribosylformylglycinamidine synthase subunit PurS [Candidatus Caenarcaniphilales bacterium]
MTSFRYSVSIMPRPGILDPQGRAVEAALPQLGASAVHGVRVGRRVELTVDAEQEPQARAVVERLASDFLANPLVEDWRIEAAEAAR